MKAPGAFAIGLLVSAVSCAEPSGPPTHEHSRRLLIPGTEDGAIVVDLDWGGIIRRMGPRFTSGGPALLSERDQLVSVGRLSSNEQVMVGIDVQSGLEQWRVKVADGNTGVVVNGVRLGASAIALHPVKQEVYLWRASRDGEFGVAAYDYVRHRVTTFLGPITARFRGMAALPVTAAHPNGCLAIGLDAGPFGQSRAFLHVVCDGDYALRDSVPIPFPSRFVTQVSLSSDGNDLIVATDLEILQFDARSLALTTRASRPIQAPFFLTRETGKMIVADVGSELVASTGLIYVLDESLELSEIVDLRVLPFVERPLGIIGAEESVDGRWLYLIGGVPADGPIYGPEETHVLVIERSTGLIHSVVRLGTFGGSGTQVVR